MFVGPVILYSVILGVLVCVFAGLLFLVSWSEFLYDFVMSLLDKLSGTNAENLFEC